ncbi:hypothetical protein ABPG72_022723 [Tetrahymena utriculariae]
MSFLKYDLFSSKFQINVSGQQIRKGTVFGMLLSILIIGLASAYFIYILYQYFTNDIEPNYREQSFITRQKIDIELSNNLLGFRFENDVHKSIQQFEAQQNKTYLVFIALFFYYDNDFYQNIQLDIIKSTDENLIGYYCLDYSKIANYTLTLSTIDNIQSQMQVLSYGCLDLDQLKTTIPDNFATQDEIDKVINGVNASQRMKFYLYQYNATSQQTQINSRNAFVYTLATYFVLSTFRIQKQVTSIKQGFFIQSLTKYSSPIQHELQNQVLYRQYALTQCMQQIQVQYSTLPQVLVQVNSTIAALMLIGIIGKQFSYISLRNDFLMILLKNVFQEKYFEILKNNTFLEISDLDQRSQIYKKNLSQQQIKENLERQEKDDNYSISVPTNNYKFKQEVEANNQSEISNILKLQEINQDEIRQINTTFTQKKPDFPEIEQSQTICNKNEFLKSQGLNKQSFNIIKSQIDKDLNILELYQDIIFLKKEIMILFTTDQLAAIRLIGYSSSFLDSQILDFETQKDISHYEKQFAISLSDELQYKYVNKSQRNAQRVNQQIIQMKNNHFQAKPDLNQFSNLRQQQL